MPVFKEVIETVRITKAIPTSWKESTIILIPKPGQDQKEIKNYRPISLLNIDYKIFATILAGRLKTFYQE